MTGIINESFQGTDFYNAKINRYKILSGENSFNFVE